MLIDDLFDGEFLSVLGRMVVGAAIFAVLARPLRLPAIVAFLLAGVVLGPVLGWVHDPRSVGLIRELGIVLLLFLVGLELSFQKIRDVGRVAVVAGLGQVIFTAIGGLIFCKLLGFDWMDAVFLAVGLTFSSTVVVVKILSDKRELDQLYGRIAVGIFLVQDLVVIVVLTVLAGLGRVEEGASWIGIMTGVGWAGVGMVTILAAMLSASRWVLPRLFGWASSSPVVMLIWALGWCLAVVSVTHWFRLSIELGAFLAGLSLAQLPYHRDLQHRIRPLMNFCVAVFFVSLGLDLRPSEAVEEWFPIVLLSFFVLVGNPLIFIWLIRAMGYPLRVAFCAGLTVAQISEFSFIFAAIGATAGLVSDRVGVITAMVGVVTIALSAYLILYNGQLFDWGRRLSWWREEDVSDPTEERSERSGHVVVVGMNTLGRRLVCELCSRGLEVVAVDTDPSKLRGLPCETILGNAEFLDVLLEAGLPRARLLVSAIQIEEANDLLAYRCRAYGVPCAIHAVDLSVVDNLMDLGTRYLMLPKVDGVKAQAVALRTMGVLKS